MRWVNASERLPELGKEVIWKWGNLSGSYVELADWVKDLHGNPCIRTDNLIDLSDPDNQYYWLDETPASLMEELAPIARVHEQSKMLNEHDWLIIEKEFTNFYMKRVYESKPMGAYDVVQWFKNKLNREV